jgi:TDG/mug DNA glycosylase family protein
VPTKAELEAARGREIPHVLEPGLRVVFVGINPGLWSGATGHHFARPGNRFWKVLHFSGFTDRILSPTEDVTLPRYGIGVTNLVARTTAKADELTREELRAGARTIEGKLSAVLPRAVAVLGIEAYRKAFRHPNAKVGPQPERIADILTWVLPNPSGVNANYQIPKLVVLFEELRRAIA